jgi:hypothetical protein
MFRILTSGVTLLLLASCGGASKQAPGAQAKPTTAEPAPAEKEITGPPKAWEEMSYDAQKTYMMDEVVPVMGAKFKAYDSKEFSDFGCPTCHGPKPKKRKFEMPNPELPKMYPSGSPEQKKMVEKHPEMVKFMFNEVVPTTAKLLGMKKFDEETGEGFSCYHCHPAGESETHGVSPHARGEMADAESPETAEGEGTEQGDAEATETESGTETMEESDVK